MSAEIAQQLSPSARFAILSNTDSDKWPPKNVPPFGNIFPNVERGDEDLIGFCAEALTRTCYRIDIRDIRFNLHSGSIVEFFTTDGKIAGEYMVASTRNAQDEGMFGNLIKTLSAIRNPWGYLEDDAKQLVRKLGFDDLFPVIAVVAKLGDFPSGETMTHGKWVSIVAASTGLGNAEFANDLPLIVVFGSQAWENGQFVMGDRARFTLKHELAHYLTYISLLGHSIRNRLCPDVNLTNLLGWSAWEGIADILSERIDYARLEAYCIERYMAEDFTPAVLEQNNVRLPDNLNSSYAYTQKRILGGVPTLVNALLWSSLLTYWQKGEHARVWNSQEAKISGRALIDRCFGQYAEICEDESAEHGQLVRRIFLEDQFDWVNTVTQLRSLSEDDLDQMLSGLQTMPSGKTVASVIKEQYQKYGAEWDPFGGDSLKTA